MYKFLTILLWVSLILGLVPLVNNLEAGYGSSIGGIIGTFIGYLIVPGIIWLIRKAFAEKKAKGKEFGNPKGTWSTMRNTNSAIDKIKRAKELKELGVISEAEYQSVLRKHKGDATKGL